MHVSISKPTKEDYNNLPTYEITSFHPCNPDSSISQKPRCLNHKKLRTIRRKLSKLLESSGIPPKEWQRRLAGAPIDVITKTLGCATQLAMHVECETRSITRKHMVSRFPMLKNHRRNDIVHSDTFFPSTKSAQGHTCSQLFIGERTDFIHVEPMKSESCSHLALQDFLRKHGIPHSIKTDNARTETGTKWTEECRRRHINQYFTEPRNPQQNYAEHGVHVLSVMVRRTIREHGIPYSQHH